MKGKVRQTEEDFVSGLPDMNPLTRGRQTRTLEDAIADAKKAPQERRKYRDRKFYHRSRGQIADAKRVADRIMGESDD